MSDIIITSAADAEDLLAELGSTHDWVSVFWDRGWGDDPSVETEISIIVDGNGQQPKALITTEVYTDLLKRGVIRPNSLKTMKARRCHDYCDPDDNAATHR